MMAARVKIAYDFQIFCQQDFGGVSRYFSEIASRVALSDGFDVKVFAPIHANQHLLSASSPKVGIYNKSFGRIPGSIALKINRNVTSFIINNFKPNLIHDTYYQKGSKSKAKCPRVLTVFDMINEIYIFNESAQKLETFEKLDAVSRSDAIICISEHTRQDLIRLFDVPVEKTHVVHLGFTLNAVGGLEMLPSFNKPYILYVGNRSGYKNFRSLLDAYSSSIALRGVVSIVAFGGGELSVDELQNIEKLGIPPINVVQISGDDRILEFLYRNALCFVYPSKYEGFGIPPLEAMSFSCPVVCSNSSSMPEVVGDAAVMVSPLCVDEIRDGIESVVFDSSLRERLIQKGKERVGMFSWDACARGTVDVYRTLL
jgi:glycosyltransferase involved in cell wall biosynthesis